MLMVKLPVAGQAGIKLWLPQSVAEQARVREMKGR